MVRRQLRLVHAWRPRAGRRFKVLRQEAPVSEFKPESLDDVIGNADIMERLKAFAITGDIPMACIFSGEPGIGKTTSALAEVKEYMVRAGVYPPDVTLEQIRANAAPLVVGLFNPVLFVDSRTRGNVDYVNGPVVRFLQGAPPKPGVRKFVIWDEADMASHDAKEAIHPLIERFAKTSSMIFTSNEEPVFALGPAIVSRAGGCNFKFEVPSKVDVRDFLVKVADRRKVDIPGAVLSNIAERSKDIREALGNLSTEITLIKARESAKLPPPAAPPAPIPTAPALPPPPAPAVPAKPRLSNEDVERLYVVFENVVSKGLRRGPVPTEVERFDLQLPSVVNLPFQEAEKTITKLAESIVAQKAPTGRLPGIQPFSGTLPGFPFGMVRVKRVRIPPKIPAVCTTVAEFPHLGDARADALSKKLRNPNGRFGYAFDPDKHVWASIDCISMPPDAALDDDKLIVLPVPERYEREGEGPA